MTAYQLSDRIALSIDEHGVLRGSCASWLLPAEVKVMIDRSHWATVPSHAIEGSNHRGFRCDLPPVPAGGSLPATAFILDADGDSLASIEIAPRLPALNAAGVPASDILALHDRPFFGVPYISFDGARLTIVGSHLPPGGDPSALGVEFGPGVVFNFQYPAVAAGWERHFWYWPNAVFSDFILTIDLAASAMGSDPFTFRFTYAKGSQRDLPEPYGRVWIPRDLGTCVGFPADATQLTRVQTWSDCRSVTLTGYNAFRVIDALFERFGVARQGTTIMDWGCGHGRVTRHFVREWPDATIVGTDVDAENASWAADNIRGGKFASLPLLPPCRLPDACLDAVFSISVMTHLTLDVQLSWLEELARLVRPGGIVLMSFGGPGAVAWSSVWNGPEYYEKWQREGIHSDRVDAALEGKISDASYYRNTAQTHDHVRRHWCEHFDILEIAAEAIGNLDIAVLRRRSDESRSTSLHRRLTRKVI